MLQLWTKTKVNTVALLPDSNSLLFLSLVILFLISAMWLLQGI